MEEKSFNIWANTCLKYSMQLKYLLFHVCLRITIIYHLFSKFSLNSVCLVQWKSFMSFSSRLCERELFLRGLCSLYHNSPVFKMNQHMRCFVFLRPVLFSGLNSLSYHSRCLFLNHFTVNCILFCYVNLLSTGVTELS